MTILRDRAYRLDRYIDRPRSFVEMFMPSVTPTPYQADILDMLGHADRTSVRAPHGVGKSAYNAWAIWWFALTRDYAEMEWKIPTTASHYRQLRQYLWPEIHKWAHRLDFDRLNRGVFDLRHELLQTELHLRYGRAWAMASSNPGDIEGAHADAILYVFDEAKEIPAATFDAAEGAFSTAGTSTGKQAKAIATSTPGDPSGRFYAIQSHKPGYLDWKTRHVTRAEAIEAGQMAVEWVNNRRDQWGEQSALFQNRVEGEFHSADEDAVIPLRLVEAAVERWHARRTGDQNLYRPDQPPADGEVEGVGREAFGQRIRLGVDVARGGADKTMIAVLSGSDFFEEFDESTVRPFEPDTMVTAGHVARILRTRGGVAVVDVVGIGAGVFDRLREQGLSVIAFSAGSRSERTDVSGEVGFVDLRSEAWWALRMELSDPRTTLALPDDDELIGDLVAPHYAVTSGGKYKVESKADLRKRLGRSTDKGDAVVMAMWSPVPDEVKVPPPVSSISPDDYGPDLRRGN